MDYEDKEYYWEEMSYHIYPVLSHKERLSREFSEQEYEFLYRYFSEKECKRYVWGEW